MSISAFKVYDDLTGKSTVWSRFEFIGKGKYSRVYSFFNEHKVIACKIIKSGYHKEILIHERLKHPNIVNLITYSIQADYGIIGMELCQTTLLQKINPQNLKYSKLLPMKDCKNYLYQLNAALKYLKKEKIVHCDIKPANILLLKTSDINAVVKLADFGLSSFEGDILNSPKGTPNYMAPEIAEVCLAEKPLKTVKITYKFDTWAFGCVAYMLCIGVQPFLPEDGDLKTLCNRVVEAEYIIIDDIMRDIADHDEKKLSSLINSILIAVPKYRAEPEEIEKHDFFANI